MQLEQDLINFLKSGKQLDYDTSKAEPDFVGLHTFAELKIDNIWVKGECDQKCYYEIPAISLTGVNYYYDPEFILLWLPNEQRYGTWDNDHWDLFIFDESTWNDIVKNPLPYINYQWEQKGINATRFNPKDKYKLKTD